MAVALSRTAGSAITPVQMIEGLMYDIFRNPDKVTPEAFLEFQKRLDPYLEEVNAMNAAASQHPPALAPISAAEATAQLKLSGVADSVKELAESASLQIDGEKKGSTPRELWKAVINGFFSSCTTLGFQARQYNEKPTSPTLMDRVSQVKAGFSTNS